MAIYHLHVGIVSRKTGRSSVAAAAYRSGEKLHSKHDGITYDYTPVKIDSISAAAYRSGEKLHNEHDGKTHDYTKKTGVVYSEIMLPKNALKEYKDRATLWNAVEKSEKRYDAQTARDIDVALPIEFNRQEQIETLRKYIQENFVAHGMCADFSIHDKGDGNPHAHILLTTRDVTEKGFGKKNREWNKIERLEQWRENWAIICNEKLREKGLSDRIDHRTLKAQGIDREPTIHIGVATKHMERAGRNSDRMREYNKIIAHNEATSPVITAEYIHELKQGYCILDKEISTINQQITNARSEMQSLRFRMDKIKEDAEHILVMRGKLDELKTKRHEIGFYKNKKTIDEQISYLERSREQAEKHFKRSYYITPEQAVVEIKRLEYKSKDTERIQERLQERISPLEVDKKSFTLEYQKQKLLAEINPNGQRIKDKLTQLDKENHLSEKTAQDRIARLQSERNIEKVTKDNFQEILQGLRREQAEALNKLFREHEKAREYIRVR